MFSTATKNQFLSYLNILGPTENVIGDFWLMIWQENITIIVMLTNLIENDKVI